MAALLFSYMEWEVYIAPNQREFSNKGDENIRENLPKHLITNVKS